VSGHDFRLTPVTLDDIEAILAWHYPPPYQVYDASADEPPEFDAAAEMCDLRNPHFAARLAGEAGWERQPPAGFFAFGSACEVGSEPDAPGEPHLRRADGSITIGLGLRPDLTGRGLGLGLVEAGLAHARDHYQPSGFRLFVYAWNLRAIQVYERAGFAAVGRAGAPGPDGRPAFIEMWREAGKTAGRAVAGGG
jgi:[ribosomal protein S18]-alanine N-acetyltransferase